MANVAAATTIVVVVPAVLHPLVGPWALLWPALVAVAAGLLLAGATGFPVPGRTTGRPRDTGAHPVGDRGHGAGTDASGEHPRETGEHTAGGHTVHGFAGGPAHGISVGPLALPTAVSDYDLHLTAVVHWRWSGHVDLTVRNPAAPAVRDVVVRAASKVARTRPRDRARTECDLGARLAVENAVTGTGIVVWAEHVRLRLADEDADRLAHLGEARKDLALRAALQAIERAWAVGGAQATSGGAHSPGSAHAAPGGDHAPGGAEHAPGEAPHWPSGPHTRGSTRMPGDAHTAPGGDHAPGGGEGSRARRGTVTDIPGAAGPEEHGSGHTGGAEAPVAAPFRHHRGPRHHPAAAGEEGEEDYVYLDPVHGMPEEPVFTGPEPGHDVDEYGYESYWWPAESVPDSAEEDVQVAILRGMIEAVPDLDARSEFAERQLRALEKAGYGEVARRVREGF